jgi:hypothetical protein
LYISSKFRPISNSEVSMKVDNINFTSTLFLADTLVALRTC